MGLGEWKGPQIFRLGQIGHQRLGPGEILILGVGQEIVDARGVNAAALLFLQHLHGEGDHQRDELHGLPCRLGGHVGQLWGHLVQGKAGEGGV